VPEPTPRNRRLAWAGGIGLAVVLLVVTLLALSHEDPTLRPADSVPTTTSTSPTMTAPYRPPTESGSSTTTTAPTTTAATSTTGLAALPTRTSRVATVRAGVEEVDVHPEATGGAVDRTIDASGDYGQRQVFLVIESEGPRLHVRLPVRPNGATGWIDAELVDVHEHDYQIQVSLSGFELVVQRGDEIVLETPIGVGTQDTPTIGGEFYTWVLIDPTNAGYGSYAYGLSGFSTLESFAGGDGRMGIHGTADESSIGRNVSHGCVRVPDAAVVRMVEEIQLPLGVPVTITA
jgi:lipoprotein-anchoring transpeptidase ErfK/SrfK